MSLLRPGLLRHAWSVLGLVGYLPQVRVTRYTRILIPLLITSDDSSSLAESFSDQFLELLTFLWKISTNSLSYSRCLHFTHFYQQQLNCTSRLCTEGAATTRRHRPHTAAPTSGDHGSLETRARAGTMKIINTSFPPLFNSK